jgi:hypothetical protein
MPDDSQPGAAGRAPADLLTIVAIGLTSYIAANLLHEGAGHGGACLLTGGTPQVLSTVHFECSRDTPLVLAGGTLMNFAAGCLFWALLRAARRTSGAVRYFLWFSMTINLFEAGGYFLFSGVANIGDWADFIKGWEPAWAWHVALTILGLISYALFIWLALLELRPLIGSDRAVRTERAVRLTVPPYLAGGTLACIAGLLNPVGMILVAISAAAGTFGGSSGLAWMAQWLHGNAIPAGPPNPPAAIPRNWAWIGLAAVLSLFFILVLGPSIQFQR